MRRSCILITGFEPFGGDSQNVSWELARTLHGRQVGDARIKAVQLPCVFGLSLQVLGQALDDEQPALVLSLGQAAGRAELSLERVAINLDDARIPDNAGKRPLNRPVVARAPAAYFSTLPVKAMAVAVQACGVPVGLSQTAGSFVCNHVFYGLQHRLRRGGVRSGFMHLPLLPQQAALQPGTPSLDLEAQRRGVRAALAEALRWGDAPDLADAGVLLGGSVA